MTTGRSGAPAGASFPVALAEMVTDVEAVTAPLVAYREKHRQTGGGGQRD